MLNYLQEQAEWNIKAGFWSGDPRIKELETRYAELKKDSSIMDPVTRQKEMIENLKAQKAIRKKIGLWSLSNIKVLEIEEKCSLLEEMF